MKHLLSIASTLVKQNKRSIVYTERAKTQNPQFREKFDILDPTTPDDFNEFNRMIGNPLNRNTDTPQDITDYQQEYFDAIQEYHKIIANKSRKIGATEIVIRSIAYNVFRRYRGHDIMIVAGNDVSVAREILQRFYELFQNKPRTHYSFVDTNGKVWYESDMIKRSSIQSQRPTIEFYNGTRVMCYAASRQGKSMSFRGADDVICIFLSEAAHTGMLVDQPIMNALEPNLANRDDADFILESTPNGRRGFFFDYWSDIQEGKLKGWHPLQWDYKAGIKSGVLSKKYVQEQKSNLRVDFAQEYQCRFTSTISGIFTEEDIVLLPEDAPRPIDLLKMIGRDYTNTNRGIDDEET